MRALRGITVKWGPCHRLAHYSCEALTIMLPSPHALIGAVQVITLGTVLAPTFLQELQGPLGHLLLLQALTRALHVISLGRNLAAAEPHGATRHFTATRLILRAQRTAV